MLFPITKNLVLLLLLSCIFSKCVCKLNIFISGKKLNAENLKVRSFCQENKNQTWINKNINKENNIKIENAILNKAKKLRLQSS